VGANVDAQDDVSINIAGAISANPANVRLRFFHDGSNAGTSHYHWQIDDIQIVELFNYDLNLSASAISSWDPATAATYDSLRYSIYPFGQLRPVPLNMTIVNEGSADQPGITANFTVTEGANTVLDQDQTVDVDAGTSEKVFVNPDFVPPTTAGTYNVAFSYTSAVGDTSTGNDAGTASFKVDDFKYARDLGTVIALRTARMPMATPTGNMRCATASMWRRPVSSMPSTWHCAAVVRRRRLASPSRACSAPATWRRTSPRRPSAPLQHLTSTATTAPSSCR